MIVTHCQKAAVQKEALSLAGMIPFDDIAGLNGMANLLSVVKVFGVSERGKNLIKPDTKAASNEVSRQVRGACEDLSGVTTRGKQGFSDVTTRVEELPRQNRVSPLPVGLYATVRAREEGLPAVITVPNEPHLTVISSSNEGFCGVITRAKELTISKMASLLIGGIFGEVSTRAEGFSDISTVSNEDFSDITTRGREGLFGVTTRGHKDFITVTTRDQTVEVSLWFSHDGKKLVCRYFTTNTHKAGIEFFESIKKECAGHLESVKKNLPLSRFTVYGNSAPAKSGAGIGVLITCIVPTRTKRVFLSAKFLHTQIMVGWMRLPKGRPVSIQAGYANLVQLTTSLRLASLGGEFKIHCIEAAIWLLPPPKNRLLSGVFTLASNPVTSLLPLILSQKPDLCYLMPHACLLPASVPEAHMLNQFTVLGYGTNKRGLTVGINYQITSDSTAKATAHAMLQAQRNGLTRITITRVMGATA